ncbi:4-hydroxy-tetrahydrodipicolinate reductase [Campylobacter aviculae]|uniref:4-hydroxy-tetrahydrodipicolinate reductase n=1 Tax=Campylobacter aviculae TaxID=2510190 RepID=A0A4U7BJV4_9BACT|nr:4-hydroxy-tetrahydrodipicolinate reductase [Campylobacter aviculae]TKX30721.1 4-hydroxy-tetrahydrodipicolinate reductase [Campylobacter aviculae]
MISIGIYGAKGRMGKQIQECLENENNAKTAMLYDKGDDINKLFEKSDVIIDFSSPEGTYELLNYAKTNSKPLVIGTTGLDSKTIDLINDLSKTMPIFYATNMSLGVAVLNHLVGKASAMLENFDIEIVEMHHRHKKDAPSGTAMTLAQNAAKARNLDFEKVRVSTRDGIIGERDKNEIAVMSLRGGDIVGRHTVGFYEDGEFLELSHVATSRATFAKGAIKIAIWLKEQNPKLYSINDFLGI